MSYGRTGRRDGRRWLDTRRSARSLMPSLLAWWEPGLGMATSEASFANVNNFSAWALKSGHTVSADPTVTDPLGGTAASKALETAPYAERYLGDGPSNASVGPTTWEVYAKPIGGRHLAMFRGSYPFSTKTHLVTGSVTSTGACSGTDELINGWWKCQLYAQSWITTQYQAYVASLINIGDNPATAREGDVTKGLYLFQDPSYSPWRNHRCSALSDQVGTADLSNSSSTSQIFVQKAGDASPGGNSWGSAHAAIWQPNDVAKTLTTDDADLMTVLDGDFTIVADIWVYAAATAAVPLFATTADVPSIGGLGTDRKLYVTCGTSVAATAALAVGRHQIAFRRVAATETWTIFADGAQAADPTALTPGGATTPSELTVTMRATGLREALIDSTAMSNATTIAVLNALKAAA